MARTVQSSSLGSRSARAELARRHAPRWLKIAPGRFVGWRRYEKPSGVWRAKVRTDDGHRFETVLGTADDVLDPDGVSVLNFAQAQEKARSWFAQKLLELAGGTAPADPSYTVNQACSDYLAFLQDDGRSEAAVKDARYKINAFIRPALGTFKVATLTPEQLRKWRTDLIKVAPRLRTRKGEAQKHRDASDDRARKATVNRVLTTLKAMLNHAFDEKKTRSNEAWGRRVKPFKNVEAARVRFLQIAECAPLGNACEPDFRKLVQAALQSGARISELARLKVEDFDADAGIITIRQAKGKKARHIVLTDEGVKFFAAVCAGRAVKEIMLPKADGKTWGPSQQKRRIEEASEHARITPPATFHVLRHTWASHAVMAGMPLMVVAKNLGHRDTRMVELHYGHLAPNYVANEIRAKAPRFGWEPENLPVIR